MLAKDVLRCNKTCIQWILAGNHQLIVERCYKNDVITLADRVNLSNITQGNEMDHVILFINNIMGKGEKSCKEFLDLLQKDEKINEVLPQLKHIRLNYTPSLPKPAQESSSTAKTDDVGQGTKLKLKKVTYRPVTDELYPLKCKPTGLCFIINNVDFNDNKPRLGSVADAEKLAEVFSSLGFRVLMCEDQTRDQMDQVLKCFSASDFSKLVDFKVKEWSVDILTDLQEVPTHGDAFICCILSHGDPGVVFGTDWERLSIRYIVKMFKATDLSPLTNKPKVFLIQACQGTEIHGRVVLPEVESDDLQPTSIPEEADFLVGMSTVEDYKSYRQECGSWYIQSVCKQMEEGCPSGVDMYTILERVNNDVSLKEGQMESMPGEILKQMPEIRSTLRKKLVFSPHSKSAKDTLRLNKKAIVEILSKDLQLILNKFPETNTEDSSYRRVSNIVDEILDEGETACIDFLDFLKTDEMSKETYPGLQGIELKYTDYRDYGAPVSDEQNQELKKRIANLCLAMNNPTEGSVGHGSAIDAGHFFERMRKIFPLKNPLGSHWILGGVNDTIYKGKDAVVKGWGKFYLPKDVKMTVIGVIGGTSCPNELVLMICEDEALYAYDGEELHAVAVNVDQLLDNGIEYPAAKSYNKTSRLLRNAFKFKEQFEGVREEAVGKRLEEEHRELELTAPIEVLTRSISFLDEAEYYALTHNPRGWCVIINNEKFTELELRNRRGTQEDTKALTEVFTRLGFKVDIENDLTADEIRTKLQNVGREDFLDHDALVVCVLSHGDKGVVYGSDERRVYLEELTLPFTADKAPTLAGKPKLFFIEASQGCDHQRGAPACPPQLRQGQGELHPAPPETTTKVAVVYRHKEDKGESRLAEDASAPVSVASVANNSDLLIGLATMPGYTSFRNTSTGCIYTQELCRQLMRSAGSSEMDDILTILTRVNREVNKLNLSSYKQMPQPYYTLTKRLVLKFV